MSTIYLVRHGITQANKENRFAGRTDEELHADGREQTARVGKVLAGTKVSSVYCGPAKRTLQSAEILAAMLGAPFWPISELDEINIPHWDGLTKDEIRRQYGEEYPTWLSAPHAFNPAGCETLKQVQDRAVNGVSRLRQNHDAESLLLVSHLIVLRCLLLYYQGMEIKDFRSIKIDNGAIIRVYETERGRFAVDVL